MLVVILIDPSGSVIIGSHRQQVKIAAILPNNTSRMFSIAKSAPGIQIAIEKVRKLHLLPKHDLVVNYADSRCSVKDGPLAAFNFYMNKEVQVFLGPVCDYALAPVARYSFAWNIPVISTGGFAHDFVEKASNSTEPDTFPYLTRVHLTFDSLGDFMITMLKQYRWKYIKVLYETDGHTKIAGRFCYLAMSAFAMKLREQGSHSLDYHTYLIRSKSYDKVFHDEIGKEYAGMSLYLANNLQCLFINAKPEIMFFVASVHSSVHSLPSL